ncbi:hypothetical protein CL6EHI_159750 [Entamoeba histolytica]|uniref:RRM domain-containing protein n=3 Tax=Entamoeba histolytica TaxID=5759 RepID=C4LX54_ENTH1|nr:hypothetical protein EHI_159750 [Entamoeba histolytica HM-1:IMSS]EAL46227.1 hypothetical protein EHI_159750 [Entamoeba histolytica HM-1:IMSS]GAT93310.1 hypothetical protein CL6EHI_159750 [Entamoeba histolytica]|eukprot:XP_651613.1 hypothetical protein EHI_159750 [Entamoeba histolytica HM-1:IMSS]
MTDTHQSWIDMATETDVAIQQPIVEKVEETQKPQEMTYYKERYGESDYVLMFWNPSQPLEQWMIKDLLEGIDVKARGIRVGKTGKCYADFENAETLERVKELDGNSVGDIVITVSAVPPRDDSQKNSFNKPRRDGREPKEDGNEQRRRGRGNREGGSYRERKENQERKERGDGEERSHRGRGGYRNNYRNGEKRDYKPKYHYGNEQQKESTKEEVKSLGTSSQETPIDSKPIEHKTDIKEIPTHNNTEKKEERQQFQPREGRRYGERKEHTHGRREGGDQRRGGRGGKKQFHASEPIEWDNVKKVSHPVEQQPVVVKQEPQPNIQDDEGEWQEVKSKTQKKKGGK